MTQLQARPLEQQEQVVTELVTALQEDTEPDEALSEWDEGGRFKCWRTFSKSNYAFAFCLRASRKSLFLDLRVGIGGVPFTEMVGDKNALPIMRRSPNRRLSLGQAELCPSLRGMRCFKQVPVRSP